MVSITLLSNYQAGQSLSEVSTNLAQNAIQHQLTSQPRSNAYGVLSVCV